MKRVIRYHHDFKTIFSNKLFLIFFCALVYFLTARLGLTLTSIHPSVSLIWPPSGLALALLLILGYRVWPAIFAGAFFVNLVTAGTVWTSFGIAAGNTLEAIVGAYLVARFAGGLKVFDQPEDVFRFVLFAGVLSTTIAATFGVTSLAIGGFADWGNYRALWTDWWLGDMIGIFIISPLVLLFYRKSGFSWNRKKVAEFGVLILLILVIGYLVFSGLIPRGFLDYQIALLVLPILAWLNFRFSQREAAGVNFIMITIAIWGTLRGYGPFVAVFEQEPLFYLQYFMAFIPMTVILGSAVVSRRRVLKENLEKSERRFHALIEHSLDAIALIDGTSKITYMSASTESVLGYKPNELVGTEGLAIVHKDYRENTKNILIDLVSVPGKTVSLETVVKKKSGHLIWVEARLTNLLHDPAIGAIVVNFRDITEHRYIDQERNDFVSIVSHQLRNPLASIKWVIELLLDNNMTENQQEKLKNVYKENERLINIVNDLLILNRVEIGRIPSKKTLVDVENMIGSLAEIHELQAKHKGMKITYKTDSRAKSVFADTSQISEALKNILDNAISYGAAGTNVDIETSKSGERCVISIHNEGAAISTEDQPRIFGKFYRGTRASQMKPSGSGLGLYIAKLNIEKNGGSIWFESPVKDEQGVTFYVSLPVGSV